MEESSVHWGAVPDNIVSGARVARIPRGHNLQVRLIISISDPWQYLGEMRDQNMSIRHQKPHISKMSVESGVGLIGRLKDKFYSETSKLGKCK